MLDDLQLADEIRLRKPHPCGGDWWRVVRVGADVGLVCLTCNRKVMVQRAELARRVRETRRGAPPHSHRGLDS